MKYILIILLLVVSVKNICAQEIIPTEINSELAKEGIIIINEEINIDKKRKGKKLIITENSKNLSLNDFDIENNTAFISDILSSLDAINSINNELKVMLSFSDKEFSSHFNQCSCNYFIFDVIELYKSKWNSAKNKIEAINISQPNNLNGTPFLKITKSLLKIKDYKSTVKSYESINTKFDKDTDLDEMLYYVSNSIMPSNREGLKTLSAELMNLNQQMISFLSYVSLLSKKTNY